MLVDELIYDPFCICFFFTVVGLLEGKSLTDIKTKIKKDYWSTQIASWKVWPIVQIINFSVVPKNFTILFINLVGFFWGIFMQIMSAKK